ncbi:MULTISPECIES: anti-sigma factor [unclassified Streptomyces]|uniref:anti-sigma factor n=1 Tax=unclassified Streptomyces TaxID=2593676 RepID=UPI001BE88C60|nr:MULTISPECIES: anti-sigma factor [unclassified Streptomyces]MBT2403141.1 anti-sigma factor [Streptomyces sp. ISL-21]MBT2457556.1 anti-sigma factor [Streptomyces sp. ISL-86]MBT2610182.1 anti-sigma factor [Streptomyces sp. ISL-87]
MRNDDMHTLTGAYALHALTPEEHDAFTAHLAHCASCRQEAAEFTATAGRLAGAAALPAPPGMKTSVMHGIDSVRQLPPRLSGPDTPVTFTGVVRRKAAPLVIAACLAAAAALAGIAAWQHQQADEARQQAQRTERRLQDLSTVMAAPDARTVHGRTAGGATTSVVSSRQRNRAVFIGAGLSDPGAGRTYQLWFDDHGTMRPAGLLRHDGATLMQGDLAGANAVGLTLEPEGGSLQPSSKPLILLALPA